LVRVRLGRVRWIDTRTEGNRRARQGPEGGSPTAAKRRAGGSSPMAPRRRSSQSSTYPQPTTGRSSYRFLTTGRAKKAPLTSRKGRARATKYQAMR
jgi:hypothetical protein